jgi:hypothetical protein
MPPAYVLLGLLYFPARVGFRLNPHACELATDLPLALFSLTNYPHIALFAVFFAMSKAQFRTDRRSTFGWAALATLAVGALVEIAEGITGQRNCRLRDLIPDSAGVFLGAAMVFIWNRARIPARASTQFLHSRIRGITVEALMKAALVCCAVALLSTASLRRQSLPSIDHHQHHYSPATAALAPGVAPVSAEDLVKLLDQAGIRRAVVLSVAYQFGNPNRPSVDDEYAKVRAENDWTSQEVACYPDRLRGFCGVNPLKDYAFEELARCAKDAQLHFGLKRPREAWAAFQQLPLSDAEFRAIESNVAPYMR